MIHDDLLDRLAARIDVVDLPHPTRVAVNGVDGAGKTTLADDLVAPLRARGRTVIRASIDSFHHPRAHRYRRGRESPEGCYHDSFQMEFLHKRLLEPLGPGGDLCYRAAAFDYRTDSPLDPPLAHADPASVLVLDGIFLLRPELAGSFDLTIFLDVSFDRAAERSRTRDEPETRVFVERRYLPAQKLYLEEARPRERADVWVDYEDLAAPRILRGA